VPLKVDVTIIHTDPEALLHAVEDDTVANALAQQAATALASAAEQAALAALIGAAAVGLLGGIAVSTLTGRRRHALLVVLVAVLAAGVPVAVAVGQIAAVGTSALEAPACPVAPPASLQDAARAAASPDADPELTRAVAIAAVCSPSFQSSIEQALARR